MMQENKDTKTKKHSGENFSRKVEELSKKLVEAETQLLEMENNWKRALADYQNLQKRTAEERTHFVDFANSTLVRKLLPLLDNLELLEKHTNDEGLKMIIKEFKNVLKEENVEELVPLNEFFDAAQMEALETLSGELNKVIEVVQKGYLLKNKLLRPARVKVGNGSVEE